MDQRQLKTILFLCTGNYYRSRFAEVLFNAVALRGGLPWRATSRGLALERGLNNRGPMARTAVAALKAIGILDDESCTRLPVPVTLEDLERAERIIALKEDEHRPMLQQRFTAWADRVEYWQIDDVIGILPVLEGEIMELVRRLQEDARAPR
jgi:protein-tyrosine phosphatase